MKQISLLLLILIFVPSCRAQQKQTTEQMILSLDSLINAQIKKKKIPSIAIGVVKKGKVVLAKGYGYSNVEEKILANENTIYQMGSVTKMFTGHLLASLIDQGKMALSDSLSTFFPRATKIPIAQNGQVVTIKEIATHSSEFPRYPENLQRIDPNPIRGYSSEEMLKGIELVKIDTVIGVRYNYSNFGYGVLGTAMENLMDKDLSELMNEHIFTPYGMDKTSLILTNTIKNNLAIPYLEVTPYLRTEPWDMGTLSAAGNLFSSITDLNKFMIEMMSNKEINNIQQNKYFQINKTWSYGLGCFIIDSKKNTTIIYHGGDIDGYASSLSIYPEFNLGFVILTNWGEGQAIGEVFTKIDEIITKHFLNGN